MKGPQRQYTKELMQKFGYIATWLPGVPLKLGDIGTMKNNVFTKAGGLEGFKISFDIRRDPAKDDFDYTSKGSVSITGKLSGKVSPKGSSLGEADAGFIVDFGREDAILFKLKSARINSIEDTISIGTEVLKLYNAGDWKKEWVIVTELVQAESGTIFISSSKDAKIELKANANIDAATMDIADATFKFTSASSKNMQTNIVAGEGLTPLFKAKGINRRLLKPAEFGDRNLAMKSAPAVPKELYLEYVTGEEEA